MKEIKSAKWSENAPSQSIGPIKKVVWWLQSHASICAPFDLISSGRPSTIRTLYLFHLLNGIIKIAMLFSGQSFNFSTIIYLIPFSRLIRGHSFRSFHFNLIPIRIVALPSMRRSFCRRVFSPFSAVPSARSVQHLLLSYLPDNPFIKILNFSFHFLFHSQEIDRFLSISMVEPVVSSN